MHCALWQALFGVDLYENWIEGYLVYAGDGNFNSATGGGNATYGCGTYDVSSNPLWATLSADPSVQGVILLVQRNPVQGSECYFSTKVFNAQNAPQGKVVAVIVADEDSSDVILMRDDERGRGTQTYISSMFVTQEVFKLLMNTAYWPRVSGYEVYVYMEYYLPNPDGRVEMDMLMQMTDTSGISFLTSFGAAARVLQYRLFTTMHYWVFDGSRSSFCITPSSKQCTDNCLITPSTPPSVAHYYCNTPVNSGPLSGVKGTVALQEIARQSCLQQTLSSIVVSTPPASNYANATSYWMWTYWELFYPNCAYANSTNVAALGRFSQQCSQAQMQTLHDMKGAPAFDVGAVITCSNNILMPTALGNIIALDAMISDWYKWNPPINQLYLWINGERYDGTPACRTPITEATCGPLSAMCYGYATDSTTQPYPVACTYDNQCTFGTANCTGINTITPGRSVDGGGVSAGAVVGIVIAFLVVLVAGLYYWHRRQQLKVKQEVDALLKQYLPMDPGATHGVAQGNHKTREQQERRLIQDMDLEDQDMETRDDI